MTAVNREIARRVLALQLPGNDADAATVREYLIALLRNVWTEQEGFSGKRPFGNSGWEYDLYVPLIKEGLIDGSLDEDGYIEDCDNAAGHSLILVAIEELGK